jgi:hypothetical protein
MLKQQVKLLANEVSVALLYDVKSQYSKQRTFAKWQELPRLIVELDSHQQPSIYSQSHPMREWCVANCADAVTSMGHGACIAEPGSDPTTRAEFAFELECDCMLFKLRWASFVIK